MLGQLRDPLVKTQTTLDVTDDSYEIPLHFAVKFCEERKVQIVLDAGANANSRDGTGNTPPHLAVQEGSLRIGQILLKHGANASSKAADEMTPVQRVLLDNSWNLTPQ